MSRIGKKPVEIPDGVNVNLNGNQITIQGPKGKLELDFYPKLKINIENKKIFIVRDSDSLTMKSQHGLIRSLIANMILGVTKGYEKRLLIEGVGYKAELKKDILKVVAGYSHAVNYPIPSGIEIICESPQKILIKGIDKCTVGQVAAEIRKIKPPEPYLGKGIRYEKEKIIKKAGKARV